MKAPRTLLQDRQYELLSSVLQVSAQELKSLHAAEIYELNREPDRLFERDFQKKIENTNTHGVVLNKQSPIKIIFEESTSPGRMAELIQILSEVLGEDLNVIQVTHLPPDAGELVKAG